MVSLHGASLALRLEHRGRHRSEGAKIPEDRPGSGKHLDHSDDTARQHHDNGAREIIACLGCRSEQAERGRRPRLGHQRSGKPSAALALEDGGDRDAPQFISRRQVRIFVGGHAGLQLEYSCDSRHQRSGASEGGWSLVDAGTKGGRGQTGGAGGISWTSQYQPGRQDGIYGLFAGSGESRHRRRRQPEAHRQA